jgi:HD-like signal output (HDOD) protein
MLAARWKDLLQKPGSLPALPEVLIRLQFGLYQLDVDIDDLCDCLQLDPALTVEILKTVNSPLFGIPRRIASLRHAVVLLGLRRMRAIILSQSLRQSLAMYPSPAFKLTQWWDCSVLSATAAGWLCQRVWPDMVEEAFLSGLIAEVGILVLARHEPRYEAILRRHVGRPARELHAATREELDVCPIELTAEFLDMWKFPSTVVNAVRHHQDPAVFTEAEPSFLSQAVYVACLLTEYVVSNDPQRLEQLAILAAMHMYVGRQETGPFIQTCLERYRVAAEPLGFGRLGENLASEGLANTA